MHKHSSLLISSIEEGYKIMAICHRKEEKVMHNRSRQRRRRYHKKSRSNVNFTPVIIMLCLSVGCGYAAATLFVFSIAAKTKNRDLSIPVLCWCYRQMAGVAGFEPTNAGVKVPCLTTWRYPKVSGVDSGVRTHDFQSHNLALYH